MKKVAKQYQRGNRETSVQGDKEKEKDVRLSNIEAAKAVADAVRTSLGPRGMDKMICAPKNEIIISNDGATILKQLEVTHPTAKMLVELSKAQDIEAGDGTTSVVVLAGALLSSCQNLLTKGIHPTKISESFGEAAEKSVEILEKMSIKLDLSDRKSLIRACTTSLSSKVVSQYSDFLAPLSVDAVLSIIDPKTATNVDLRNIRVVKKLGTTIEKTKLIEGLVFPQKAQKKAGGPSKIKNAKIGLIQFCLSPPKTDMDNNLVISDHLQIDRILKEERTYLLKMCKKIKKTGCNVLLIQKSILRDATTDLSLHFLAKMKIMVVEDIERKDIEFISKTLNCRPIAHIDSFTSNKLGTAGLVEELSTGDGKVVQVTGIPKRGKTITVFCRASNRLILDEAERSIHDALCVVRSLIKKKSLIVGGGAPEVELSLQLGKYSKKLQGDKSVCFRAFAEALEIIPTTLAENAGLKPIHITTELRNRHNKGEKYAGINVREGKITDMLKENVIQPLLVNISALTQATETVRMILKIDDIIDTR